MRLLLIRHAEAVNVGTRIEGRLIVDDSARPLSEAGRSQCPGLARALSRLGVSIDRLVSSPLLRAKQTAEEICVTLAAAAPKIEECQSLAPGGKKRRLVELLREHEAQTIALVGHNPDLSELVGWFLGDKNIGIDLDKAGMASILFEDRPGKGQGTLEWLVTPDWCKQESPSC